MRHMSVLLVVLPLLAGLLVAADWPQWRGPKRDDCSAETGYPRQWPPEGPRKLWTASGLGKGYASVAVAEKRLYTTGLEGKDGVLFCLDLDGKQVWKAVYGPEWTGSYPGARTTPTVDGKRVYLMSGQGLAACYGTDGKKIWVVDTAKAFGGVNIGWGISESVLVEGKAVICSPGGPDASVVALDKATGATLWRSKGLGEPSGYCSAMALSFGQKRVIVTMTASSVVGLDAADGKVLWTSQHENKYKVNANTPVYADGILYISSGYGKGGEALEVAKDGSSVKPLWKEKSLDCHHGGVLLLDGFVYGSSMKGQWHCLDLKTGEVKWTAAGTGKGAATFVDGMLIGYGESGKVGLMGFSPQKLEVVSSFKVDAGEGEHWAHPVVSDGRLYIRHGGALSAYELKQ